MDWSVRHFFSFQVFERDLSGSWILTSSYGEVKEKGDQVFSTTTEGDNKWRLYAPPGTTPSEAAPPRGDPDPVAAPPPEPLRQMALFTLEERGLGFFLHNSGHVLFLAPALPWSLRAHRKVTADPDSKSVGVWFRHLLSPARPVEGSSEQSLAGTDFLFGPYSQLQTEEHLEAEAPPKTFASLTFSQLLPVRLLSYTVAVTLLGSEEDNADAVLCSEEDLAAAPKARLTLQPGSLSSRLYLVYLQSAEPHLSFSIAGGVYFPRALDLLRSNRVRLV